MEREKTEREKTERERKRRAAAKKEERKKKGKGGEDKTLFSLVFVLWDLFSRLRGAACRWRVARWGGGKNPRKIPHVRFRFSFLLFPDETKKNSKLKQVQRVLNQFVIKASDIPAGLGLDLTRCEFHWEDYFEDALDNIAKLKHEDPAAFAAAFPAADRVGCPAAALKPFFDIEKWRADKEAWRRAHTTMGIYEAEQDELEAEGEGEGEKTRRR